MHYDLIVVGGGAAGIFCAIQFMEQQRNAQVLVLEKSSQLLGKVRVSGGGRCNVTHACFDPAEMVEHYPRGDKELLGPFHRFLCGDMMGWLDDHGVPTKIEDDGRVFPVTDSSQTIIDCFLDLCERYHIDIRQNHALKAFTQHNSGWQVQTEDAVFDTSNVMIATGGSPAMWGMLGDMGYQIVEPVPSLFTFNIIDPLITGLPGISVPIAHVKVKDTSLEASGPLLITHWGLSGPGVLKLSAWGARQLSRVNYHFTIAIDWTGVGSAAVRQEIESLRQTQGKAMVDVTPILKIPKRLWRRMVALVEVGQMNYASLKSEDIKALVDIVSACRFDVTGKSTFKEEFVTCGGVDTREVNFKTMESKRHSGLYFAGEVLNIDAITGGFNFQACWTGAFIAARAMCASMDRQSANS